MSEVYQIFGLGCGFPFGDGISTLDMLITYTDYDRLVINPVYNNQELKKDTIVKGFVPCGPGNDAQNIQDAFMLFAPTIFEKMKDYSKLKEITSSNEFLSLSENDEQWNELRRKARPIFKRLNIFELEIKKLNFNDNSPEQERRKRPYSKN